MIEGDRAAVRARRRGPSCDPEPSSARTLGTPNGTANDRTANTYDAANELTIITAGYGTSVQAAYPLPG
jgi:hypothetical protein